MESIYKCSMMNVNWIIDEESKLTIEFVAVLPSAGFKTDFQHNQ